jgi:hypothetical protein
MLYYSQVLCSDHPFSSLFPFSLEKAISSSSPSYSFIHRPSSDERENQQGVTRRC